MTEPKVIARDSATISEIRPFLHLSGLAPLSSKNLKSFTCVINCVAGLKQVAPSHITVLNIPIEDEEQTDLSPYWKIVFQTIEEQRKSGGKVLIFCGMGISRSASFVVAYLMCIEKMTLHDAYKNVQRVRNIICPNVGFFKQMIELEYKLYNKNTVKIIEPIPGVEVADVVWNELYDEVFNSSDKSSLSSSMD
uniref:Tyrosine-protein phosphatase domain-containing protein n=1 Tax=Syphacia muris TaxID=451379 RepID=A0A0N5AXK6_9BILA